MQSSAYFLAMAHNNAWSNHRLLTACATLSDADFAAERVSFFPSLNGTLNHNLMVDRYYVDAPEGGRLGLKAFAEDMPCPTAAELCIAQTAVDRRLIAYCVGLSEDGPAAEITMDRGGHDQVDRADRVLLHLFQHQIHHRGQAHAMLAGTGVKPPQLDKFFMTGESPLRAGDFAALGFTERGVWAVEPTDGNDASSA